MQRPWGGGKHIDWEGHSGCTAKLRECVISVETKHSDFPPGSVPGLVK